MTDAGVPWRYDIRGDRDPNADAKDRTEAELLALLLVLLAQQGTEVRKALDETGQAGGPAATVWARLKDDLAKRIRPLLQVAAWTAALRLIPQILGKAPSAQALVSFAVEEWAWEYTAELATDLFVVSERAVETWLREGRTPIGGSTLDFYFGRSRAEEIAVTQTTEAFTGGETATIVTADGYGIQTEATWHTMRDELVCWPEEGDTNEMAFCGPRDGEVEGNWGIMPDFPPLHHGCRCWVTYQGAGDVFWRWQQ